MKQKLEFPQLWTELILLFLLLTLSFPQEGAYSGLAQQKDVTYFPNNLQKCSVMRGPKSTDLLYVPLIVFSYVTISLFIVHKSRGLEFSYENNGTDLTFKSSDGGWNGEEDMLYGRNFDSLLVSFELYRLHCKKEAVTLLRTKEKKNFWKWAWWFDNYSSAKWKVPYIPADSIKRQDTVSCPDGPYTPEEKTLARKRARIFLDALEDQ